MSRFGWFVAGLGLGAFAAIQAKDNPQVRAAAHELLGAAKDVRSVKLSSQRPSQNRHPRSSK